MMVYTALFGAHDQLRPPPAHDPAIMFVCVTDQGPQPGWGTYQLGRAFPGHDRLEAKYYKVHPPAGRSLWVDASVELLPGAVEELAELEDEVALFRHPARDCIYQETQYALGGRYSPEDTLKMRQMARQYTAEGYPRHNGLWQCTVILRNRTERLDEAMGDWWDHIAAGEIHDQMSFSVVMDRAGIRPTPFPYDCGPGRDWAPWFYWHPHLRDT
jgi:hypothetical protein